MKLAEKNTDLVTKEVMRDLLRDRTGPCVSMYLPTHRKGPGVMQDRILLKNLLRQVTEQLRQRGVREVQYNPMLQPVLDRMGDNLFWQHQSDGLAVFAAPDYFSALRLPREVDTFALVGEHFHIKPLLPAINGDGRFYVLALSHGGVRILECTRYTFQQLDLERENVPTSLAEAMRAYVFEPSVQFHTRTGSVVNSGDRAAIFHGQGAADDDNRKRYMLNFYQQLDNGVRDLLAERREPLVLAGVEYVRGLYHEANHYDNLVGEAIDGSPEQINDQELHRRAWGIMEPHFQRTREEAVGRYQALMQNGSPRAANRLQTVVPAAYFQRVDTLFVPLGRQCWGTFDPDTDDVVVRDAPETGDEDLLNVAALCTLRNAGHVYALPPDQMPDDGPVAAIFRY